MIKTSKADIENEIETFFKKYNISGIINVPKLGTFSLFNSEGIKLLILEHAKIEQGVRQEIIDNEIKFRINDENQMLFSLCRNIPFYIR